MGGHRMQSEGWSSRDVGLGDAQQSDDPLLQQQYVPGPNAEISWGLLLYCICGTENSPPQESSWQTDLLPCPALARMGPLLTAGCVHGGTGGKGRPPPPRTDMPGLHQHLPGGTAGVQLCAWGSALLRLLFIPL